MPRVLKPFGPRSKRVLAAKSSYVEPQVSALPNNSSVTGSTIVDRMTNLMKTIVSWIALRKFKLFCKKELG